MRILLAIDGSPCSRKAESVIRALPLKGPIQLKIVTVCPSADLHAISAVPETVQEMVDQCRRHSQQLLDEAAARCTPWCSTVETELLDGHPAREVVLSADQWKSELIVVGARGQGAVSRFFLGSVSDSVTQQAHCPVLVVRHLGDQDDTNAHQIRRILLPYDTSPAAQKAAERVASFQLTQEHTVHIRSIVERAPYAGVPVALQVYDLIRAELEPKLSDVAAAMRLKTPHVNATAHIAPHVADDLIDIAKNKEIDLIVMGNTGKTAWERLLLGSVTSRVLHHVPCSVWIERVPSAKT